MRNNKNFWSFGRNNFLPQNKVCKSLVGLYVSLMAFIISIIESVFCDLNVEYIQSRWKTNQLYRVNCVNETFSLLHLLFIFVIFFVLKNFPPWLCFYVLVRLQYIIFTVFCLLFYYSIISVMIFMDIKEGFLSSKIFFKECQWLCYLDHRIISI